MKNLFRPIFLRFIGFASIFQFILVFGFWLIFITVVDIFHIQGLLPLWILGTVFVLLWASFTVGWFFIMQKYGKWRVIFSRLVFLWLGTAHFLFLASVAYWFLRFFSSIFQLNWPLSTAGKILYLLGFLISAYGVWNSYKVNVKTYKIRLPGLPANWIGKKIVMFADSHLGNIRGVNFIKNVVKLVNEQNPDLVLIPGDYFDGPPADFELLAKPLSDIQSPNGVYFANGNHEELINSAPFVRAISGAGVKILNNDFVNLEGLQVVGVSYHSTDRKKKFRQVLEQISFDRNKPTILIKHVPSNFEIPANMGVSLMLSGHTHRAQVFPFAFLTKIIFKGYDYGLKSFGPMQVLTTSGVGTWGPPQRVGTNSEIVVIVLE